MGVEIPIVSVLVGVYVMIGFIVGGVFSYSMGKTNGDEAPFLAGAIFSVLGAWPAMLVALVIGKTYHFFYKKGVAELRRNK